MADMMTMLASMKEQQELLLQKMESIEGKVNGMEDKMRGMEQQQAQMKQKQVEVGDMKREIRDLTKDIRFMDWEKLCWRQMKWTLIPDDARKHVLSFLTVPENICLNNAIRHL